MEPCPKCRRDVAVAANARRVSCGHCGREFAPEGRPTTIGEAPAGRGHAPHDPNDSLVGLTFGRWTLTRLIGRGGMGRVYEARDKKKGRRVALKVLREDLASDPSFVRRFHRESKLLASLSHPHVVDVIDRGEDQGRLWFAMGYVRGESLRRRIDRGRLKPKEAARIAAEIAGALAYAHRAGVVHRDLKPENVLLDADGGVHLVDFGLSRLVNTGPGEASTRLTRTDVILGTYEYMAPEQRRGERQLDGRADVFALGVILYEMLTGSLPLGRFTPPSDVARNIPTAFDDVVNQALATERKNRFATADEFQESIEAAVRKPPKRPKASTAAQVAAPVVETPVPHHAIEEARTIMRHVEIIAALDRVGGILLILGALGFFSLGALLMPIGTVVSFGGIILFILGIYMVGLGKRVATLQPGARESQVTASVIMLVFPPFLTALGIYALIVMTSDRARRAFRLGRAVLGDEEPHPIHVKRSPTPEPRMRPEPVTFVMRAFTFLAILWSVYVAFLALDVFSDQGIWSDRLGAYQDIYNATTIATVFAVLVTLRMLFLRRRRRGFGLALTALIFLYLSSTFLDLAIGDAKERNADPGYGAVIRVLPRSHVPRVPLFLHRENPK